MVEVIVSTLHKYKQATSDNHETIAVVRLTPHTHSSSIPLSFRPRDASLLAGAHLDHVNATAAACWSAASASNAVGAVLDSSYLIRRNGLELERDRRRPPLHDTRA